MAGADKPAPTRARVTLDPLLLLSASIALGYGIWGPTLHLEQHASLLWLAIFKASPVFLLAVRAVIGRAPILTTALLFGSVGDAFLVWPDKFLHGAVAFLLGHLCYINLFLRAGIGVSATLKQPPRLIGGTVLIGTAIFTTLLLVPRDSAMLAPLSIYTGVLTLMVIASFTLPTARWLAMAGAVLFFVSDGFVAWDMFHAAGDATLASWRNFAGWMIYWAGQAALCYGALNAQAAAR